MKVAWLTIYGGMVDRGAEVLTREVAKRLAHGHEVTVFQGGAPTSEYSAVQVPGVMRQSTDVESSFFKRVARYVYLDAHSRQVLGFTRGVLPTLYRKKWDVVIPSDGGWQVLLVRRCARQRGVKCVVIGMAGVGYDDWWNLKQSPDLFVSLSPMALSWAAAVNRRVPATLIPPGVDMNVFSPKGTHVTLDLPGKIVLCVGALVPYKRIELAIQALTNLQEASLLVVGSGPMEEQIKELGSRVLGRRFALRRFTHRQMPAVYRSCNVFTLPSRASEAFGIAYLEAMASGLPVVAPDDENRRFIVGEAGVLTEVQDAHAYRRAIVEALDEDYGEKAARQAQKFSWDTIAHCYEQALTACVSA